MGKKKETSIWSKVYDFISTQAKADEPKNPRMRPAPIDPEKAKKMQKAFGF